MSLMILSSGSCAGKKSSAKASAGSTKMDALNGKEGVFAVMETEKGKMVLELF